MKSCLIITVYENRCTNLINWLESPKSWIKEKVDIFLLVQENDPCKDEYKSLCNHINIIYCNAKNICEKRKYGYHWAIDNGYDVLIWTDDDINPVAKYRNRFTLLEIIRINRKISRWWCLYFHETRIFRISN